MNALTIGETIGVVAAVLFVGLVTYLIGRWAYRDAEARGMAGWLVVLLIISGGGAIAWLALRPEAIRKSRILSSIPIQTTSQEL
jgi:ABC-type uncharacterized transport system permease subunit